MRRHPKWRERKARARPEIPHWNPARPRPVAQGGAALYLRGSSAQPGERLPQARAFLRRVTARRKALPPGGVPEPSRSKRARRFRSTPPSGATEPSSTFAFEPGFRENVGLQGTQVHGLDQHDSRVGFFHFVVDPDLRWI